MIKNLYLLNFFGAIIFLFFSYNIAAFNMIGPREIKSEEEFNQIIQQEQQVLVAFYANLSGTCQRMMVLLGDIEREFSNVTFVKVNIDLFKNLADSYNISTVPTLVFFKVDSVTGLLTKSEVKEKIQKFFD